MNKFVAVIFALILTGCAATEFQKQDGSGGYSETQLSENIFQVNFTGNSATSHERASDFALLRAADLTLEKGFKYFRIVDNKSLLQTETVFVPATTYTYPNGYSFSVGGYSGNYESPIVNYTIFMTLENDSENTLEARYVIESIESKYRDGKFFMKSRQNIASKRTNQS